MCTTANEFSGAALRLAYGDELWEPLGKESTNKFAIFSGDGMQVVPQTPPIWARLVDTPERLEQLLLGKELLWKTATIATGKSGES
ncbi:hypothetical protein J3459_009778 [Metarhizium acridum]|nr:hypothetical protein J3459_009778 [Metarhizium acridum]